MMSAMTYKEFEVSSVLLDQENPRFEPTSSQREAANMILSSDPEKTLRLARDILSQAAVNPSELPFVLVKDGKKVVIEGNRRFTTLKLLRNPGLIDDKSLKAEFTKLAATGIGPDEVMCGQVSEREEARHWIKLRHTGQNEGVGVSPWNSEQSNRFDRRRGSQTDRAGIFCDVVAETFPDEDALLADIAKARAERITTVGRLVGDPDVRAAFGFDFDEDDLVFEFPLDEMLKIFRRIFADLSGDVSVSDIKSKKLRREYVADVADDHPDPSTRLPVATTATEAKDASSASSTGSSTAKKTTAKAKTPERRIYENVKLSHLSTGTQAVLTHARKVQIKEAQAVCAVMVRVVLELALTEVGVSRGWFTEKEKLRKKITTAIKKLDPDCENASKRDKSLEMAWIKSSPGTSEGVAVDEMNAYVHNFMASPSIESVQTLSGWYGPLLTKLNAFEKDTPTP
jgi:hypothetical protein